MALFYPQYIFKPDTYVPVLNCFFIAIEYADNVWLVGGVAQWLGRRSVAGGLSLIYGWRVTTLWVRRPLWVNQLGQLSLPSLRGR